jgi:hypothetical protein
MSHACSEFGLGFAYAIVRAVDREVEVSQFTGIEESDLNIFPVLLVDGAVRL